MRIAIFSDLGFRISGGIPSSIYAQKVALEKLGHSVTIFYPDNQKSSDKSIVILPTHRLLKINRAPIAKSPTRLIQFIDNNFPNFSQDFDLIHAHYEASASITAIILAKKYHLPLVQTMHGREDQAVAKNVPHPFKNLVGVLLNNLHRNSLHKNLTSLHLPIMKEQIIKKDHYLAKTSAIKNMWELMIRQANYADIIITPSAHFAKKLQHYHAIRPIIPISNGVSDELLTKITPTLRTFQPAKEPLRIIWSSRVSHEKRFIPFLQSLNILQKTTNNFILTVLGDGNELNSAKFFVKKHHLTDNVVFLGTIPHQKALSYLQGQHLSITNSYSFDTQGLTLLEAGAVGLPVIYCDKDMSEVVLKKSGLCAKNHTPEAMAELIKHIFSYPDLIGQMSKHALKNRDQALQSTQIIKLINLYKTLLT